MGLTPDRHAGVLKEDDGIDFSGSHPVATVAGQMRWTGTRWSFYDGAGEYDPRSGGGISEAQHKGLDTLVHEIAENAFVELIYSGNNVTNVTYYTDAGKGTKIRSEDLTYAGGRVTQTIEKQYDGAGLIIVGQTLTTAFTYIGGRVTSAILTES